MITLRNLAVFAMSVLLSACGENPCPPPGASCSGRASPCFYRLHVDLDADGTLKVTVPRMKDPKSYPLQKSNVEKLRPILLAHKLDPTQTYAFVNKCASPNSSELELDPRGRVDSFLRVQQPAIAVGVQ